MIFLLPSLLYSNIRAQLTGKSTYCTGSTVLQTSSGSFQSQSAATYINNLNCKWTIKGQSENSIIKLDIIAFQTVCGYDTFTIYDADNSMIANLCGGDAANQTIFSTTNQISAKFVTSNYLVVGSGFNINFESVEPGNLCSASMGCLNNGTCNSLNGTCSCPPNYSGVVCQYPSSGFLPYTLRERHAVSFNPILDVAISSFGKNSLGLTVNDLIVYNFTDPSTPWSTVSTEDWKTFPLSRYDHSSFWFEDSLILFGGLDGNSAYIDVWSWNLTDNLWELIGSPCLDFGASCPVVYEPAVVLVPLPDTNFNLYVYGGVNYFNDVPSTGLYQFNSWNSSWSLISNGPSSFQGGTGIYHAQTNSLRFFGGYPNLDVFTNIGIESTFQFSIDTGLWIELAQVLSKEILYEPRGVVIEELEVAIFHGGMNIGSLEDCIEGTLRILDLACNNWQELPGIGRMSHGFFYRNGSVYIMGGLDESLYNDFEEIPLTFPLLDEGTRNQCRILNCSQVTECGLCQESSNCHWCNNACAYDIATFPLGNITTPPPQILQMGSLVDGLCPSNYTSSKTCPQKLYLAEGVEVISSVGYQAFQDFYIQIPNVLNTYLISVTLSILTPAGLNQQLRLTLLDALPHPLTSLQGSLTGGLGFFNFPYTRVRVAWKNENGAWNANRTIPDVSLEGQVTGFNILVTISNQSLPTSSDGGLWSSLLNLLLTGGLGLLGIALILGGFQRVLRRGRRRDELRRLQQILREGEQGEISNLPIPLLHAYRCERTESLKNGVPVFSKEVGREWVPLSLERLDRKEMEEGGGAMTGTSPNNTGTIGAATFLILLPGEGSEQGGGGLPPFSFGTIFFEEEGSERS